VRDCIESGLFGEIDMLVYQIVMFSHRWSLKAWHFAARMDVDACMDRRLKPMLRGVPTAAGERSVRAMQG